MSDKGAPFVDPLAPGGSAHGYQWISPPDPEPEPEPQPEAMSAEEQIALADDSWQAYLERRRERMERREDLLRQAGQGRYCLPPSERQRVSAYMTPLRERDRGQGRKGQGLPR